MEQTGWAGPSGGETSTPGFFPFCSPACEKGQPTPVPSLLGRVACSLVWAGWTRSGGCISLMRRGAAPLPHLEQEGARSPQHALSSC